MHYLTVSVGQGSDCGLARDLTRLYSCWLGLGSPLRLSPLSEHIVLGTIHFHTAVEAWQLLPQNQQERNPLIFSLLLKSTSD